MPQKIFQKISFLVVFLLFFVLGSCGTSYSSQQGDPYRSGTDGIVVSFLTTDFAFYDQQYLRLELKLENKGAYDSPEGKIVLSGYDPTIVKISSEPIEIPSDFSGKNQYSPEGSQYFVQVPEDAPVSLPLGDTYSATIQASSCYTYQTIATPNVCLLYNTEDTNICQQDSISLSSQGGPVAVTSVEQDYQQDQTRFTVTLSHLGTGKVLNAYDTDAYDACPFSLTSDNLNHVGVKMEINGLGEPTCVPSNGYVALNQDGIGVIICTFTLHEQRTYTTPLKITLDYGYFDVISQDMVIYESSVGSAEAGGLGPSSSSSSPSSSGSSSGSSSDSRSSAAGTSGDCYCSDANMRIWGGCVCLYLDGQMYYCSEGTTQIPASSVVGDIIQYEVHGSSTVTKCGDSASPSTNCPYTGSTSVPKKLSIYGTVTDGRTVSERCNLVVSGSS